MFRTLVAGIALLGLVAAAGFHHQGDPEQRIDWLAKKLAQELQVRPEQQAGFDALVAQAKQSFEARRAASQGTREQLKAELAKTAPDADTVGGLAKNLLKARAPDAQIEAFIDQATAFYKTLDATQQKAFVAHAQEHFLHAP
jgi:hypothetical protein